RILVPRRAGLLAALGLVIAPAAYDIARTRKCPLLAIDFRALADDVADMQREISAKLKEIEDRPARFELTLGLGYIGQSYHVPVSVDPNTIATLSADDLLAGFARAYREKYGYFYDDIPVELVTVHVTGVIDADAHAPEELHTRGGDALAAMRG